MINDASITTNTNKQDAKGKVQFEELQWNQVMDSVQQIDPELYQLIDALNPGPNHSFIKVRYPFGANLIQDGICNLPTVRGGLLPIYDDAIPKTLRDKLTYQNIPLGILLNQSLEVYRELDRCIFSIAVLRPGLDLGIYETFSENFSTSVSVGARSLCLLPKITDTGCHKNLKRFYGVKAEIPQQAMDHWEIFKEIVNHANFSQDWFCDILFLSSKWLEKKDSKAWLAFQNYLLQKAWQQTAYSRNRLLFEMLWKDFNALLITKDLRPSAYIEDSVRHLIYLALGLLPGLAPADKDNSVGPVSALQQIYLDVYKLKTYVPTILRPSSFSLEEAKPIYYSLQYPTIVTTQQIYRNHMSVADDLRDLKELLDLFLHILPQLWRKREDKHLIHILDAVKFDFFHSDAYTYGGIRSSAEMAEEDPGLMAMPERFPEREFCYRSTLVRGCVRISRE